MSLLDWGAAGAPLAGEVVSGDRAVVAPFPGGALVGLIDGLGHGHEAAEAAKVAEEVLLGAPYAPLVDLVGRAHEELRRTRGVVISVAQFDWNADLMTWLGVGNVEAMLVRCGEGRDEAVALRGGTVGYMLPPLVPRSLPIHAGDTLVLATDGIKHGFKAEVIGARSPQQIADEILREWSSQTDDALVIVARYLGSSAAETTTASGRDRGYTDRRFP